MFDRFYPGFTVTHLGRRYMYVCRGNTNVYLETTTSLELLIKEKIVNMYIDGIISITIKLGNLLNLLNCKDN